MRGREERRVEAWTWEGSEAGGRVGGRERKWEEVRHVDDVCFESKISNEAAVGTKRQRQPWQ